jgi:hypothetical protein
MADVQGELKDGRQGASAAAFKQAREATSELEARGERCIAARLMGDVLPFLEGGHAAASETVERLDVMGVHASPLRRGATRMALRVSRAAVQERSATTATRSRRQEAAIRDLFVDTEDHHAEARRPRGRSAQY